MKYKLVNIGNGYILVDDSITSGEIIADSFSNEHIHRLSLENCMGIELGCDLSKLIEKCGDEYGDRFDYYDGKNRGVYSNRDIIETVYFKGFQKANELIRYNQNNLIKFMDNKQKQDDPLWNEFIDSLKKFEWDVEIEMEHFDPNPPTREVGFRPKLDDNGCLILKKI